MGRAEIRAKRIVDLMLGEEATPSMGSVPPLSDWKELSSLADKAVEAVRVMHGHLTTSDRLLFPVVSWRLDDTFKRVAKIQQGAKKLETAVEQVGEAEAEKLRMAIPT